MPPLREITVILIESSGFSILEISNIEFILIN